jgi:hypothetical protein
MFRRGATAFGKSMIHASAVMPLGGTEYPNYPTNNYPEAYWEDEEDYLYEFRRYCQSSQMYYNQRAAEFGAGRFS